MAIWAIRPCLGKHKSRKKATVRQGELLGKPSQAAGKKIHVNLLELGFAKIVHREVVRNAKGIESDIITDVSSYTFRVRKEWNSRALGRKTGGYLG
jgi:hypothetical protein